MKGIKKILVFILCAFAVICTVGFSSVNAATVATKISGTSQLVNGNYAIVAAKSGNNYYLKAAAGVKPKAIKITVANNAIASVPEDAIWTFTKNTDGTWNIANGNLNLCATADDTGGIKVANLANESNAVGSWTITDSGSFVSFKTTKSKSREIAMYNSDFRYYSSNNGSHTLQLFKCEQDTSSCTVTFETNGGSVISSENIALNQKVNRPTNPTKQNYVFVDWYTTADFQEGTQFNFETAITQNITLYAKWREASFINFVELKTLTSLNIAYAVTSIEISGDKYTKVTSPKENWAGSYLVVYEKDASAYIFNGVDDVDGYKPGTIVNNSLVLDETYKPCEVKIDAMTGGYSLKYATGYIGGKADNNTIEYNETNALLNTITFNDANDNVEIKSDNAYLSFNNAGNQMRFRYYKNTKQQKICLYEYVGQTTETQTGYDVSNVDLRFGTMVKVADYDKMVSEGGTFGVSIQKGTGKENFVACTPVRVNAQGLEDATGEYYQFAVVLTNIPSTDYAVEVTGKCYVEIDGVKYYIKEKVASVQSAARAYTGAKDTSAYTQHLGVLGFLGK